jgi:hypothetical protein
MSSTFSRVQRPGRIYHFSVNGVDHTAFIRQLGKQFHGRIEGDPQAPLTTGRSASEVRDKLQQWLLARDATK